MLDELSVSNLGIITSSRIEPDAGMVVVTGETGAGKTMLLGALRLLMGESARSDLVGPESDEALVEGRFIIDGEELVVARRVKAGRSRAYLDGAMVSAQALRDRLDTHIEIVGQHDQLSLTRPREARRLVDRCLPDREPLDAYRGLWQRISELRLAQRQLGGDTRALERERDLVAYQVDEIDRAGFSIGEDVDLEIKSSRLANAEKIAELTGTAHDALTRARVGIGEAVASLRQVADLDASQSEFVSSVEGLDAEVAEAATATRDSAETMERDPAAFEAVSQRLTLLGELRRKYGSNLDEILDFRTEASARFDELSALLERAATVDTELEVTTSELESAGHALRAARSESSAMIAVSAIEHLSELGFSDPVLRIVVEEAEPGPEGADRVEILFASDARLTPGPVTRVASGGELSRLVLSLRLASRAGAAGVVAFDEIDSGVGGSMALAMGAKLANLAGDRQVLCVTHLPQVAAYADQHYVVEREGLAATVRPVAGDERLEELSRMLSGLPESERGREHAEELRSMAQQARQ